MNHLMPKRSSSEFKAGINKEAEQREKKKKPLKKKIKTVLGTSKKIVTDSKRKPH